MESRLLEKLLADKQAELRAYDAQLDEYLRLSVTRASAGAKPLLPRGRVVQTSLGAVAPVEDNAVTLERLLLAKRAELAAANAEVEAYNEQLAAVEASREAQLAALAASRAAALAAPPPPPVVEAPVNPPPDALLARLATLEAQLGEALAANAALRAQAEGSALLSETALRSSRALDSPAVVGMAALGLAVGMLQGAERAVSSLDRLSAGGTRIIKAGEKAPEA